MVFVSSVLENGDLLLFLHREQAVFYVLGVKRNSFLDRDDSPAHPAQVNYRYLEFSQNTSGSCLIAPSFLISFSFAEFFCHR